jgi:hypothetical protein
MDAKPNKARWGTTTRDCRVRAAGPNYTIRRSFYFPTCHLPLRLSDPCPINVHLSLRFSPAKYFCQLINFIRHSIHSILRILSHNLLHQRIPSPSSISTQPLPYRKYCSSIVLSSSQHPSTTKHRGSSWTSSLITIVWTKKILLNLERRSLGY